MPMRPNRYVNKDISELEQANRHPIEGYQQLPIMTLEKAVETIIPFVDNIQSFVLHAKQKCKRDSNMLTLDESAAIYLYTMPTIFFSRFNDVLRAENRDAIKPWFSFLRLFMSALEKLPSITGTLWRGVAGDIGNFSMKNESQIWWSVNSCSAATDVVKNHLGVTGTIFAIDVTHGKSISRYSAFPDEEEFILIPGTCVRLKSEPLIHHNIVVVHLEEISKPKIIEINESGASNNSDNEPLIPITTRVIASAWKRQRLCFLIIAMLLIMVLILILIFSSKNAGKISNTTTNPISRVPPSSTFTTPPDASKFVGSACHPYSWSSNGTVVASGQIFHSLAIDNLFNVYVVPGNLVQILKWKPNTIEPITIEMKASILQCIFYHSKRNALYFADRSDHSVKRLNLDDTTVEKVAFGNGYGSALNQFKTAHDLFVDDNDTIFILDSFNERVLRWISNANSAIVVAAGGGDGNGPSQLASHPMGAGQFFVDRIHNKIYVVDKMNYRIQRFEIGSPNGTTILSFEATGVAFPLSVIVDGNENILVGINNRIMKYDVKSNSSGIIIADGLQESKVAIDQPTDLKFDRAGNLYTLDYGNGRVLKFDAINSSCLSMATIQ